MWYCCHVKCILLEFLLVVSLHGSLSLNQPSQQQQDQLLLPPQQQPEVAVTPSNANINKALAATTANIKPLIQAALGAVTPSVASTINEPAPLINNQQQQAQSKGVIPVAAAAATTSVATVSDTVPLSTNYGNEDPIIYLDYSSINDEILRKRTANFVYFNANFNHCRHCHRFFNIWKELAVDIRWWRQVVKLFTINCSDEDNIDMCRRAGVTQFPQVKYYWVMSNSLERDGQRLRILGKSVHAMRHLIMDKVLDSYVEHNRSLNQRSREQKTAALAGFGGTTPSGASGGQSAPNPLASMMGPLVGQLLGSPSGVGGLSSIISSLAGNSSSSSGGLSSLSSLMGGGGGGGMMGGMQGLSQLMGAVMSAGSMGQKLSIQPLANNWPELEPIEVTDTQQLVDMLPLDASKNIGALLIMETQEFLYTGLEVLLDLSPYGNQTYIARVRDERSQLSKSLVKRDDIQAPALVYVTASREPRLILTAPKYTNDEDLRRAFVRAFERRQIKYPVRRVWSMPPGPGAAGRTSESQEDEEILSRIHKIYMNDLTNVLRASLMEQVFKHPDLSDDQYNALVKYVYTLINYFPFNNDESLKFVKRLHTWLQNQVSSMDISEYKKQFHDVDEVIQRREWVACKSLSNTKAIPSKGKKSVSLFENPAQIGKVVSNLTRLFRGQQQQVSKLKNLFSAFTSNTAPVMLNNQKPPGGSGVVATSTTNASSPSSDGGGGNSKRDDSPIERIIKSLTSGSLGSDSSILKLISTALAVGGNSESGATGKSKFAREYPCGAWKLAHVMVVNEYIKDSPRKDVKHIVLHSLYQYMLHFYACPTCGNRVSDVSGEFRLNLDEHLQDQGDSVMLLWKVHNRVTKRLESELRPGSPAKVQFPSESLCLKCRAPRAQNDLVSTPNWHEKQVLNFLVHHYRPQSIIFNSNLTESSAASFVQRPNNFLICLILLVLASGWLSSGCYRATLPAR